MADQGQKDGVAVTSGVSGVEERFVNVTLVQRKTNSQGNIKLYTVTKNFAMYRTDS